MKEILYRTKVLFDEKKTTVGKIVEALSAGGFHLRGQPEVAP